MEDALAAKTQEVAELNQELEEIRAAFGSEGVQQVRVVWSCKRRLQRRHNQ